MAQVTSHQPLVAGLWRRGRKSQSFGSGFPGPPFCERVRLDYQLWYQYHMQTAELVLYAIARTQSAQSENHWPLRPWMSASLPYTASSAARSSTISRQIAMPLRAKAKARQAKEEGLGTVAREMAKVKARRHMNPSMQSNMTPMTPTTRTFPSKHHRTQ